MLMCMYMRTLTHTATQMQGLEPMEIGRTGILAGGTSISRVQRERLAAYVWNTPISSVCVFGSSIGWMILCPTHVQNSHKRHSVQWFFVTDESVDRARNLRA